MARIRSVHPSLFTDESWVSCSPLARILYIGLWTDADDQGVFEWRPLQLKMRLLPADTADASALLAELAGVGLICQFDAGQSFGAIREFRKFQRPQKPNAIHPLPDFIADYVCLSPKTPEPVADRYDTGTVNPPQMEDVGVREEKKAALSPRATTKPDVPEAFEAAWRAYPHTDGRSSKKGSLVEWRKLSPEERDTLATACARYARNGKEPKMDCGAPAMERWLKRGLHQHWVGDPTAPKVDAGPVDPAVAARRLRHWRDTGSWDTAWGPKPDAPANDSPAPAQRGAAA